MKPRAQLTITIPEPCSEDWAKMTPADKGRFCAACQKTVVDFSGMSDAEIISAFLQPDASLCGRFTRFQLDRPMVEMRPKYRFFTAVSGRVAASLLVLQAFAGRAQAQQVIGKSLTAQHAGSSHAASGTAPRTVNGKVLDYNSKAPMHSVVVQVKGTDIKTSTDKAGRFVLVLPESFTAITFTLQAHYTETSSREEQEYEISDREVNGNNCGQVMMYGYERSVPVAYEMPQTAALAGAPVALVQPHQSGLKKMRHKVHHFITNRSKTK